MIKLVDLNIVPKNYKNQGFIKQQVANVLKIEIQKIYGFKIQKKSIDARKKMPTLHLKIEVFINEIQKDEPIYFIESKPFQTNNPVYIIGMGPAGIFAAIELLKNGIKPIIIERGNDVRKRRRDLVSINRNIAINEESNYCFGEGGAGTYSDGKLYTRSNKRGHIEDVLNTLVYFGASSEILIESHPHIGTNKLPSIIESMRTWILNHGGEIMFETKFTDLKVDENNIHSIHTINSNGIERELQCNELILATGHSARDIYFLLSNKKIKIESKPFAVGVRVEHPQELIDEMQYHCSGEELKEIRKHLTAASYSWVEQTTQNAVYSFCMCPGGIIAPCATSKNEIVTNGWSPSKRNNPFANSGIIVEIKEENLQYFNSKGELRGLYFQQWIEQLAYKQSNHILKAPAQRLQDFTDGIYSSTLPECSYLPGIVSSEIKSWLPSFINESLIEAFKIRGKKMKGYLTNEAVVVGVESRSSSPVRIPRDAETLQHVDIQGLYPCGEGAGYAGGIVSAAMDGIKVARAIVAKHSN